MEDKLLNRALILDTHEDICTTLALTCQECGYDLEIIEVEEQPEVAVNLQVKPCSNCLAGAHHTGYYKGQDDANKGW